MTLEILVSYAFLLIVLLVSIGLHEYAHAWTSYKLGDPTPVLQGRLTPNPLKHIDIFGLLCVFLVGFGWGKPVITNPTYYKDSRRGDVLVAFAGPAMNLVLVFFGVIVMMVYAIIFGFGVQDLYFVGGGDLVIIFWQSFVKINIALAIFNMLPIPPLDGYRLIKIFWGKGASWIEKNMQLFVYIFVVLLLLGSPCIDQFITVVTDAIYRFVLFLFSLIFY